MPQQNLKQLLSSSTLSLLLAPLRGGLSQLSRVETLERRMLAARVAHPREEGGAGDGGRRVGHNGRQAWGRVGRPVTRGTDGREEARKNRDSRSSQAIN